MKIAHIPNPFGRRAGTNEPERIVIHSMGEFIELGERDMPAWMYLERLELSAHAHVCPSGVIVKTRDSDQGAWHAKGHNANTLGVEVLVPGVHTYATFLEEIRNPYVDEPQLTALVELVREWVERFKITPDRVVGHDSLTSRKKDPGEGFPWETFLGAVFDGTGG